MLPPPTKSCFLEADAANRRLQYPTVQLALASSSLDCLVSGCIIPCDADISSVVCLIGPRYHNQDGPIMAVAEPGGWLHTRHLDIQLFLGLHQIVLTCAFALFLF